MVWGTIYSLAFIVQRHGRFASAYLVLQESVATDFCSAVGGCCVHLIAEVCEILLFDGHISRRDLVFTRSGRVPSVSLRDRPSSPGPKEKAFDLEAMVIQASSGCLRTATRTR